MESTRTLIGETMKANEYQQWTLSTAIYPDSGKGTIGALAYCTLGLTGEAGEVADKVKKLLRDGDTPEARTKVLQELSDVCWYLARVADELGMDLEELFDYNRQKLESRKERGVLGGNGDNR
jgi:NTP pyrophosphatase (non-canonical NTP hydrolase)